MNFDFFKNWDKKDREDEKKNILKNISTLKSILKGQSNEKTIQMLNNRIKYEENKLNELNKWN